ncbi:T9SS type A sorting domain-containing protein [candidate division WOR-3 bacterium]|nr:T9SS type A sorting domain-containing protein [candidate division WOR-3 bacterium]
MKNNSFKRRLLIIAILALVASVGLAMLTQTVDMPSKNDEGRNSIFESSDGKNATKNFGSPRYYSDTTDTNAYGGGFYATYWLVEAVGSDTTYTDDTIELSFRTIADLTRDTTILFLCWDHDGIEIVSGDTIQTSDFDEDDTLTETFELVFPNTGCFWASFFAGYYTDDTTGTLSDTSQFTYKELYFRVFDDSVVVTDTVPLVFFPTIDTTALDADEDTSTDGLMFAAKYPTSNKVQVTGNVKYANYVNYGSNPNGWQYDYRDLPAEGILVRVEWQSWGKNYHEDGYTDENGDFTLDKVRKDRDLTLYFMTKGYALNVTGQDGQVFGSNVSLWSWTKNQNGQDLHTGKTNKNIGNFVVAGGGAPYAWATSVAYRCRLFCENEFKWDPNKRLEFIGKVNKFEYRRGDEAVWVGNPYLFQDYNYYFSRLYGHFIDDRIGYLGWGSAPANGGSHTKHAWNDKSSRNFAYATGWADFFGLLLGLEDDDVHTMWGADKPLCEDFYSNPYQDTFPMWRDHGMYSGGNPNCEDGREVEGAVVQFFWDLYDDDDFYDEDWNGGYDDDDVPTDIGKIWAIFSDKNFAYNGWDKIDYYKDCWDDYGYQNVDEMYDVLCHESGSGRTVVDPPSDFTATWDEDNDEVDLTWTLPPTPNNVGHFKLYKQKWGQGFNWNIEPFEHRGENVTSYSDDEGPFERGAIYLYAIRACDNDTSVMVVNETVDTVRVPFEFFEPDHIADFIPLETAKIGDPLVPGNSGLVCWAAAIDENTGEEPAEVLVDVSYDGGTSYTNVAIEEDPGEYKLLGTEVDDEGYTIAYYGYEGEENWTPSASADPSTFLKYRYRVVLESGDTVTGYSACNYTLANGLGAEYSTAYTGPKFGFGSDKLGMVYTDDVSRVLYAESDDGIVWDTIIKVDSPGSAPTVVMVEDEPVIAWKKGSINNQSASVGGTSGEKNSVPPGGSGVQKLSEVGLYTMADSFCVGIFKASGPTLGSLTSLVLLEARMTPTTTTFTGAPVYTVFSPSTWIDEAPAMAADADHNTYYSFVYNNKTIFIYRSGGTNHVDTLSSSGWCHPEITISEGNVDVLYGDVVSGDTMLLRKSHYLGADGWHPETDTFAGVEATSFSAAGPYVLAEDADHGLNMHLWDEIDRELESGELADSCYYPGMGLSRVNDDPELMMCWARKVGSDYYVVSERAGMNGSKISHARHYGGDGENDPMTVLCRSTDTYDDYEVDVIKETLEYEVENLDSTIGYKLYLELYGDPEGPDSTEVIITASSEVDTVTVYAGELLVHTIEIDEADADLGIELANDDDAGLVRFVLYEEPQSSTDYFMPGVEEPLKPIVTPFCLYQPFPNPFTNMTTVRFSVPYATNVDLKVYDVTGRMVTNLVSGKVEPGVHELQWNAKDDLSRKCAAGVYFVRFATDEYQASKKMVLVK